ncbi:MAG TPA: hypothetical protein PLV25_04505, partial [Opitutales bacterium]|nr:hypothetical protein [Opitutales bacterium]
MLKAILKVLLACVALILLVGLAAYFSSSLQRFVALRVLKGMDTQSELRFIKIRWNSVEVQGLKLAQKSMRLNLDRLDLHARFMSFILGSCVEVDSCDVTGLNVNIAAPAPCVDSGEAGAKGACSVPTSSKGPEAKKSDKKEPVETSHEPIDLLPKSIILKSLKVHGDIYLPEERHVVLDINASNIAPGAQGTLQCAVSSTLKMAPEGHFNANFNVLQSGSDERRQLSLAGKIDSSFDTHMPDLGARFESLGLNATVDIEVEPTKLTLKTFDSNLTDATKLALFSCKLLQSMDIPLSGTIDHATTLNGNLFELKAEPMPLELLKPLMGKQTVVGQFGGCAMRLAASKGDFSLDATQPITLTGVGWGPEGTVVIQGLGA